MLVKRPETFFPILLRELSAPNLQIEPSKFKIFENIREKTKS